MRYKLVKYKTFLHLEISYVQGINFVIAYLIFFSGSEEYLAFEFFLTIMNLESKLFKMKYKGNIK